MKIVYVLPTWYNCGGNRIALEHVSRLADRGFDVAVTAVDEKKFPLDWFPRKVPTMSWGEIDKADTVVATYWETFYEIQKKLGKQPRQALFYFVQQIESRFRDDAYGKMKVDMTYMDRGWTLFTEARWIADYLLNNFGRVAGVVPNCQELPSDIQPRRRASSLPVVLVEGNADAPNKGVQDAVRALRLLHFPTENWLLTNDMKHMKPMWAGVFQQKFIGVSWHEALSIIVSADILVKPSYFEGSPTPHMEAWELGTAVVSTNCTGVHEYGISGHNMLTVPVGDHVAMADAVNLLLAEPDLQEKLIENGRSTAARFKNWGPSIDALERILGLYRE